MGYKMVNIDNINNRKISLGLPRKIFYCIDNGIQKRIPCNISINGYDYIKIFKDYKLVYSGFIYTFNSSVF